jgi:hypothetical protein
MPANIAMIFKNQNIDYTSSCSDHRFCNAQHTLSNSGHNMDRMSLRYNMMQNMIIESIMKHRKIRDEEIMKNSMINISKFNKLEYIRIGKFACKNQTFGFGPNFMNKKVLQLLREYLFWNLQFHLEESSMNL